MQIASICMKCQILFSGKKKKNIVDLLSTEFAQRVVKVTIHTTVGFKPFKEKISLTFLAVEISLF